MTQGADKTLSTTDKQDLPETVPDENIEAIPELPERQSREGFTVTTMLARIAEEPEINEADRSIGNYQLQDSEWESWKAGPGIHEDEYEVESESDEARSIATATTNTRFVKPPVGRHESINKLSKCQTGKTKATGGSKRKHQDLDIDLDADTDSDSELEVGESIVSLDD
jgi:hypothetical protein